jgi:anti-anti-sigma regulatory factor
LAVEQRGPVAVVKLPAGSLFHDEVIDLIGEELNLFLNTSDCRRLVLDFGSVDRVCSELLSVLIVVHKKLLERGGRLALCSLNTGLREIIATLRLDQVFVILEPGQDPWATQDGP